MGYKLKKDNIISSESTLTSIKKGIQLPSKKTIDAFCEKYDVSRAWLYTGEGLFAKTPSGQIEPSEKDIRDALKNARMQSDSTISKVAPYLQDILVKVKYVPIDAAASFVESLYNTAYEIDSYGVMPEEGEVLDDSYMVFQVRGDSMEPTIPDGAKILARKIEEGLWESASGVVSIVYGKTLSVKRILKNSLFLDNVLTLKADNPKHGQLDVERREIRGGDVASITHNKSKDYLIWKKGLLTDYENLQRYARDKGVVKGENSFEAYCELSNRYIYNSIRNGKGAIGTDIIARIVDKFPELNVKWLCTGKGNMIETDIDANVNYKAAYEGAMMQIEALHKIIEENKRR